MSNRNKNQGNQSNQQSAASADLNATAQQQQRQENTTENGDSKGELQTLTGADVGDLASVLGSGGPLGLSTEGAGENPTITPDTPAEDATKPVTTGTTLTQQAGVEAPAAVQTGLNDQSRTSGLRTTAAPAAASRPLSELKSGVEVSTTQEEVDGDSPEVVKAYALGNMQLNMALVQAKEYVRDMVPRKPITEKVLVENQLKMLNTLHVILGADEASFRPGLIALLSIIRKHRTTVFAPEQRHRGLGSKGADVIDNRDMRLLTRVIDALVVTSGVNDLAQVKGHVDLKKLLEVVPNKRAQQNLTAFFSV